MPFKIIHGDITEINVDVVVNAANTSLKMGGGVCGSIFRAAGAEKLQKECDEIGGIDTGQAVITNAYNLPAKYIIHTAGPIYNGGSEGEEILLRDCYLNSLNLAKENKCRSIAFPLISSGIYGYPKDEALAVAKDSIKSFLLENDMEVFMVKFSKSK